MKKYFAILISVMLCATMVLSVGAASMAADISGYTVTEAYKDTFDTTYDTEKWKTENGTPEIVDRKLVLGGGTAGWVAGGTDAGFKTVYDKYTVSFDFAGNKADCYYGFGFRTPEDSGYTLYNGGRNGIPSAEEKGYGISVDVFSKGTDCEGKFVVNFNNGSQGDSPNFAVAYPDGYSSDTPTAFKIVDTGDTATVYMGETELFTIVFSGLTDGSYTSAKAYDATGAELGTFTVSVPEKGGFCFYQRNNNVSVDNVVVSTLTKAGENPGTSDAAVIVIAAIAVIALAGTVVCKKVRA